jgi:hypothetical protein
VVTGVVGPSEKVLDLFAVPEVVAPVPGGRGRSVVAGDLVLSPGRDAAVHEWLSPTIARLAVTLDTRPGRSPRDLRLAMPVPARDGSWVVDGWAASRYEPGTTACEDLDVTLAAGRVLHAELASWVPTRPAGLDAPAAERVAFGEAGRLVDGLAAEISLHLAAYDDHRPQLVHADLAGNVLLDGYGAPVVLDVAPAWRPVRWAEAVCVVDAVAAGTAPLTVVAAWRTDRDRQALLRALLYRTLVTERPAYAAVLTALTAR